MKFFKAITVVILLSVGVLLMIGVFVPEIDEEITTDINAPIVKVYAGIMNTDAMTTWVDDLVEVERTSGVLAMPGSKFKLHFKSKETEQTYDMEVLEIVPLQSLKLRIENDMVDVVVSMHFAADGLTTKLDTYVQIKGKGLLLKSFLPLMKSVVTEEIAQDFENFKILQEK
jgi:uncharacterized protein YndB with AHSA1/START domain